VDESRRLIDDAARAGITLGEAEAYRLLQLLDELARWGRAYNLTAITDRDSMIVRHLLDSLVVRPWLHGRTVADVGTGAGFPGLPLAIVEPGRAFTLIDSASKKVRFVAHAARTLGLSNVTALHARAEAMQPPAPFDTVVTRAFAALPDLLRLVRPLCGPETRVLAMKGRRPDEELTAVPPEWQVTDVQPLVVPRLDEERTIVVCRWLEVPVLR